MASFRVHVQSWNANGILNKMQELRTYLSNNKIDIMFVSEIKLKPKIELTVRGYDVHVHRRPNSNHGGIAVFIKQGVPYIKLPKIQCSIENIGITLQNGDAIVGVYNRPQNNYTENCLDAIITRNNKIILIGDLNSTHETWNCNRRNANGNTLRDYLDEQNDCTLHHTTTPTHYPLNNMTPSTIDLMISKNITDTTSLETHPALCSDHNPISFYMHINGTQKDTRTITTYKDANWNKYREYINDKLDINNDLDDAPKLENEVDRFTKILRQAQQKVSRKVQIRTEETLPQHIIDLIKIRNSYRKQWQRYRRQNDKNTMTDLTIRLKNDIKQNRNQDWTNKLNQLNATDNSLWKMTKVLKRKHKPMPAFETATRHYYTDKDKAELLVSHFESVHLLDTNNTEEQQHIEDSSEKIVQNKTQLDKENLSKILTTPTELLTILKRLPNNKAPGTDNIDNKLLKNLPKKGLIQLHYIINGILKLQHWPLQWKVAQVVPIPKPGKDPATHTNYRPISLLSSISKVAEKVVLERLNAETDALLTNDDHQFGFKRSHNTTQQLTRLVVDIINGFKKDNNTVMVLLDIEKAFDKVWIPGLIHKLDALKYSPYLVQLIHSYLTNRTMTVKINNCTSTKRQITAGVPQGSVLGPKLFNIYLHDLPLFPNTQLALFADDTAIYAQSHHAQVANKLLQYHLNDITKYYKKWKIKLNEDKTELITFTRKFKNNKILTPLTINNTTISERRQVKYLGVYLDKRLTFHNHIRETLRKTDRTIRALYPLIKKNGKLNYENKRLIYTTIMRPILTYAAPVWYGASTTSKIPLQRLQNKILRMITNSDRYKRINELHQETDLPMLNDYITKLSATFYAATTSNPNRLIKGITKNRRHNIQTTKHQLPYQHLPIYTQT